MNDYETDFWGKVLSSKVRFLIFIKSFKSDIPSVPFTGEFKEMRGCRKVIYVPTYLHLKNARWLSDYQTYHYPNYCHLWERFKFPQFFKTEGETKHFKVQHIQYCVMYERINIFCATKLLTRALILSFPNEIISVSLFSCKWETNVDFLSLHHMNIGFLSLNETTVVFCSYMRWPLVSCL